MAITGYLAEFSLPELFRFLSQGNKTGLLTVHQLYGNQQKSSSYYLWLQQGRIVAAADRLDGRGLITLIQQRSWLTPVTSRQFMAACSLSSPLGICLKTQGAIQADQLKFLFNVQVLKQVCSLFTMPNAYFEFDAKAPLVPMEMTGLSVPASEVTLPALRSLRDWTALEDKLPEITAGLVSTIVGKPQIHLSTQEWQVWEFANGTTSLEKIAQHLQLPVYRVQQIAFRLMTSGLAEEVPLLAGVNSDFNFSLPTKPTQQFVPPEAEAVASSPLSSPQSLSQSETKPVSASFLKGLVNFLRNKG